MPGERFDDQVAQDDSQGGRSQCDQDDAEPRCWSFEPHGGPSTVAQPKRQQAKHKQNRHFVGDYVKDVVPDDNESAQ